MTEFYIAYSVVYFCCAYLQEFTAQIFPHCIPDILSIIDRPKKQPMKH